MGNVKGLLWFDQDGALDARLRRAIIHYEKKHNRRATCALVNASEVDRSGNLSEVDGVSIKPSNLMLPEHYLVGVVCDDGEG